MKRITSRHHPLVAACRALARGRTGNGGRILLDGPHLVEEACRARLAVETAAVDDDFLSRPEAEPLVAALTAGGTDVVAVSRPVLEAMSPVTTPSGIVAIAHRPAGSLPAVLAHPPQLILLGVDIQDPGNVGAIARTAEAAGVTGLILCGASADPFGWKALRGSMGSLLRLPVFAGATWQDAMTRVAAAGITLVATVAREGLPVEDVDLRRPVAFVLGAEGLGLPEEAVVMAGVSVSIPMRPPVESLNVAVAAALLVYEAARQRRHTASREP